MLRGSISPMREVEEIVPDPDDKKGRQMCQPLFEQPCRDAYGCFCAEPYCPPPTSDAGMPEAFCFTAVPPYCGLATPRGSPWIFCFCALSWPPYLGLVIDGGSPWVGCFDGVVVVWADAESA
jgi:hypothetical protein